MKFTCEKAIVSDAVMTSLRGVSSKSSLQVLEGILVSAKDNRVSFCGYDLKTGITCSIEADVSEEGSVVLSARILSDIMRKLPDDVVEIETSPSNMTTIRCSVSCFNIPGLDAADFPELPTVNLGECVKIKKNVLKSMISQSIFAVSENDMKPIHTGSKFICEGNTLMLVSVDGFRLAIRKEEVSALPENMSFVVPGSALKEVEHILDEGEDEVSLYPNRKFILFDLGGVTVVTRLLEGDFLDYNRAIPTGEMVDYIASVKDLTQSVERASLIISERVKTPIRFEFERDIVKMSCITAQGRAYDECALSGGSGEKIEIGFNYRYMLDALRACPDEEVKLSVKGSLSPLIIRPTEGDSFLYLILPVRLREE